MASVSRFFGNLLGLSRVASPAPSIRSHLFAEGDRVYIQTRKREILSGPLQKNQRTNLPATHIQHNDIIGKATGASLPAHDGAVFRVAHPTLEQYVTLTPRKVTPIYAHDANLIVSLLDINVPTHGTADPTSPKIEILEAGTGHGSLTLHLARAIHAANAPPPSLPPPPQRKLGNNGSITDLVPDQEWEKYTRTRHAVIHTIDVSPSFSVHAEKTVRGFRQGMYGAHVNFYVNHVSDWISSQREKRKKMLNSTVEPFISYALLDLPSAHAQLANVASIMRQDGLLTVFVPSVTQIGDCVKEISENNIPLVLEKTIELGMGMSNGRVWDVRLASVRARSTDRGQKSILARNRTSVANEGVTEEDTGLEPESSEESEDPTVTDGTPSPEDTAITYVPSPSEVDKDDRVLVCRPKVGQRIVGGGFVALFRKI